MTTPPPSRVYGPVPSRRLGRSLGVDLVPYKVCTYDCVYCQLGRTTNKTLRREEYVRIDEVAAELKEKLRAGPPPDWISLAGSGEPTLNLRIGDCIEKIRSLTKIPVAVLTNGSLLWTPEVRNELMGADLVVPSLDAGDEDLFRLVNRPHPGIAFQAMAEGLVEFTARFPRAVWLEVMLLAGVTAVEAEVKKLATLARRIGAKRVQLNTVVRPPCETFASAVPAHRMQALAALFSPPAEVICPPANAPPAGADRAASDKDILALLRRRPCTAQGVAEGLGIHVAEAVKRLQELAERRLVDSTHRDGAVYHTAAGNG